jgi:hypothetical protein
MISPASMKKGTASSGKLLAPSSRFCARIWASKLPRCTISATPHNSSENAIGTPSAMAASRDPRKTMTVMGASLQRWEGLDESVSPCGASSDSLISTRCASSTWPVTRR